MEKRFLNPKETAVYLGLSIHTIYAWVKLGKIPFYKVGRAVRFDPRKLEFWLRKKECPVIDEDFHGQS